MAKKKRNYGLGAFPEKLHHSGILWDMHCHLDMTVKYIEDIAADLKARKPELPSIETPSVVEIVEKSIKSGINGFLHCACDLERILNIDEVLKDIGDHFTKDTLTDLGETKFGVYGAIAIHPNEAALHAGITEMSPDGLEPQVEEVHQKYNLNDALEIVYQKVTQNEQIRVIGETGLDYFRTSEKGRDAQIQSFREHIRMSKELDLPLQIHDREAHQDVLDILKKDGAPKKVLLHSFSGDREFAEKCIAEGYYASFSGPLTFKANIQLREAFQFYYNNAKELLLIETDCPFLTPEPNRGQPNAPGFIANTALFMSEFLGVQSEDLIQQIITNENSLLDS